MRASGVASVAACVMSLAIAASAQEPELTLTDAVHQALDSNLDLAAQRRALQANRESVDVARAPLLPQVTVGGRVQAVNEERSNSHRGSVTENSATVAAQVSQVLYDENDWAAFRVQQHTFDQQREQFESFRLGVIQDAADSFFELDRSRSVFDIQEENRELTRQSLETTKSRVATGYSSKRELLRWQAQLAQNEIAVVEAATSALAQRFELNRVRNRPREEPIAPIGATVTEHGFVYARTGIAEAVSTPGGDRKLRDYLVRLGLERSPVLRAIDAAIAAEERILTASERSFWVPSLSVLASVDHLADDGGDRASFDETEWVAEARLTFPLFEGGAKFASYRRAREAVASLRLARRAEVDALDDGIRTAFAQASGAYLAIGFAGEQEAAAGQNYSFVYDAYELGVADYLDLLDAQNEYLVAKLTSVNALHDFLTELMAAEVEIALFPFLEAPDQVDALLDGLERELGARP